MISENEYIWLQQQQQLQQSQHQGQPQLQGMQPNFMNQACVIKKPLAVLYGHFNDITAIKISQELAIIVSAEESGICYIHRINGRFLRKINLVPLVKRRADQFIKYIRIHQDGYILLLTNLNYLIIITINFFEPLADTLQPCSEQSLAKLQA